MKIIVSGSLAYDRIMDFPGYFADHILPDKIRELNVCFQVDGMRERFGGTAGNIAYSLALMGQKPLISATIGQDYQRYFAWLAGNGICADHIKIIEGEFTASAYITTDRADNQITEFNPGAMKYSSSLDFASLDPGETIVVVSPGNLDDMVQYPSMCRARGIEYVFDPGQSLPMLQGKDLIQAIDGCRILIANNYEMDLILSKTGLDRDALLQRAGSIIVTKGELGSLVVTAQGEVSIPAAEPRNVADPTGAGDSFRGGLICGLVQGREIERCAQMGSVCASFAVECYGTQEYKFSADEFEARLDSCF